MSHKFKRVLILLITQLSCFQMAYGNTLQSIKRLPAAVEHKQSIQALEEELLSYKKSLIGAEDRAECEQEEAPQLGQSGNISKTYVDDNGDTRDLDGYLIDENGNKIIEDLRNDPLYGYLDQVNENACSVEGYTFNEEKKREKKCSPKKTKGFQDKVVEEVINAESKKKDVTLFRLDREDVQQKYRLAKEFQKQVESYLSDNNIDEQERRDLLVVYLDSVLLPMKDLIVLMRSYIHPDFDGNQFFEELIPSIPEYLYSSEDADRKFVEIGPDPSKPFSLEFTEEGQLRFKKSKETLTRDIVTILKAPTTLNYVRALKWMTISMMANQVSLYSSILEEKNEVKVPLSCQNQLNGDLPESFQFNFTKEAKDSFLHELLISNGLALKPGQKDQYGNGPAIDPAFAEYYKESINKDPLKQGYAGLMPFEEFKAASEGLKGTKVDGLLPAIDDFTYFDKIMKIKEREIQEIFTGKEASGKGFYDYAEVTYKAYDIFKKMTSLPNYNDIYSSSDGEFSLEPNQHGVSTYLAEVMFNNKVESVSDLLEGDLKEKLQYNEVRIPFPSLYGSVFWRSWAFKKLQSWVEESIQKNNGPSRQVKNWLRDNCSRFQWGEGKNAPICQEAKSGSEIFNNIDQYLRETHSADSVIPTRRLEHDNHRGNFIFLGKLWNYLRDIAYELPVASPSESHYLKNQIKARNPWARLRLSYLVAINELEAFKANKTPTYKRSLLNWLPSKKNKEYSCFNNNVSQLISKIKEVGALLKIDRPISPNHGNYLLANKEKELLWKELISSKDPLLTVRDENGEKDETYRQLEKVSYQTFLTKKNVQDFVEKNPSINLSDKAWGNIESYLSSSEASAGQFFYKLYQLRGNPEAQSKAFDNFSKENGISNKYSAKLDFLVIDNQIKRHIYQSVIERMTKLRRQRILAQLEKFCNLEPNDHESMKTIFYATSKAQNEINKLTGGDAISNEVMEKVQGTINSISPSEWTDIYLGVGGGVVAALGSLLLLKACVVTAGLGCVAIGLGAAAAGSAGFTAQAILPFREGARKLRADENVKKIKEMEALGLTDSGSSKNVSRGWLWTAIEGVSLIPLVGVVGRSINVGVRMAKASSVSFAQTIGKGSFKNAHIASGKAAQYKVTYPEAQLDLAELVLGLRTRLYSEGTTRGALRQSAQSFKSASKAAIDPKIVSKARADIKTIKGLYRQGKISAPKMAKKITQIARNLKSEVARVSAKQGSTIASRSANYSMNDIRNALADTLSKYYSNNPATLVKTYDSYLKIASKVRKSVQAQQNGKKSLLGKYRNYRYSHLIKYEAEILRMQKGLKKLVKEKGDFKKYIIENADVMTTIHRHAPIKNTEIPSRVSYEVLLKGGAHLGGIWGGQRISGLSRFSDGIMLKKIFNSYSRLTVEIARTKATSIPGFKSIRGANFSEVVFNFRKSIEMTRSGLGKNKKALSNFNKKHSLFENEVTSNILAQINSKTGANGIIASFKKKLASKRYRNMIQFQELNQKSMRRVLFNPSNDLEEGLAKAIWSSVDVEDALGSRVAGEFIHETVKDLSNFKNVDSFEASINALKIKAISNKNIGELGIF